jgi:hypothetical protein
MASEGSSDGSRSWPSARLGKYSAALNICASLGIFGVTALYLVDERRQFDVATMVPSLAEAIGETPRILVEAQNGLANEPLPVGVTVVGTSAGATVTIEGLPDGADLSLGSRSDRSGWTLAAADLNQTFIGAPRDFVGVMEPTATLRSASGKLLDRQDLHFEWSASKSDPPDPPPVDTTNKETASSGAAAVKPSAPSPPPKSAVALPLLASPADIVTPKREPARLRGPHRRLLPARVDGNGSNALGRGDPTPTVSFFSRFSWDYLMRAGPTRGETQPSGKSSARRTEDRRVMRQAH